MKSKFFNIYYYLIFLQFIKNGAICGEFESRKRNRQISFLDSIFSDTSNNNKDNFKLNNILGDNEKKNSRIFTMKPEMNEVYGDMKKKYNEEAFKTINEPIFIVNEAKQKASSVHNSSKVSNNNNKNQNAHHVDSEAIFVKSSINERPYPYETSNTTSIEDFNNSTLVTVKRHHYPITFLFAITVLIITLTIFLAVFSLYYLCKSNLKNKNLSPQLGKNENNNNNNNDSSSNFSDDDDTYKDEDDIDGMIGNDGISAHYDLAENLKEIEKLLNKVMNEDFKSISFDINYTDISKSNFINEIVNKKDKILNGIEAYDGILTRLDTMNFELINVVKSLNVLKKQIKVISKQKKNAVITVNLDEKSSSNQAVDLRNISSVEMDKKTTTTIHFEQLYELDKAKSVNELNNLKETNEGTRATTKSEICALNIQTDKTYNRGEFRKIKNMYENSIHLKGKTLLK
jgi:hypothetical protein